MITDTSYNVGHTPAHLAALCGSIDCLKLLHQTGANLSIQVMKHMYVAIMECYGNM